MKIRPDDANLSDLLRRFNLPLPTGPARTLGTGTATAQALPKPAGSKGSAGAPPTPGNPPPTPGNQSATRPAVTPQAPSSEPNLETLLEAVGGFDVAGAAAESLVQGGKAAPPESGRANQRSAPQPQPQGGAARPEAEADQESRFISRVSPQVIARPGSPLPALPKSAPDPRPASPAMLHAEAAPPAGLETRAEAAPGARPEARVDQAAQRPEPQSALARTELSATTELPRRELLVRAETSEARAELAHQPALSPRAPGLEMATMQHWAAVEVGARTLPRNVRGEAALTPSDPPKKGGRGRGAAAEIEWFSGRGPRSNAYAVVFTLLGLLTLFVLARSCS